MNTKIFSLYSNVIYMKYKSLKYTRLSIKIIKRSIHDYTGTLINWFICKNWVHFTQEYIVLSLASGSVEDFVNVILLICYYLLLEKGIVHHLNNLKSPLPQDILCQSLVNLKHSTSLREIYILLTSNDLSLRKILFLNVIVLYMLVVFYKKT